MTDTINTTADNATQQLADAVVAQLQHHRGEGTIPSDVSHVVLSGEPCGKATLFLGLSGDEQTEPQVEAVATTVRELLNPQLHAATSTEVNGTNNFFVGYIVVSLVSKIGVQTLEAGGAHAFAPLIF